MKSIANNYRKMLIQRNPQDDHFFEQQTFLPKTYFVNDKNRLREEKLDKFKRKFKDAK